jgi:hypothetical protein
VRCCCHINRRDLGGALRARNGGGVVAGGPAWCGAGCTLRCSTRGWGPRSGAREAGVSLVSGVRVVGDPWVEIEAVCEVHGGSGRLVIRRDGERIVLDAHADECCVITVEGAGMTLLFDVLGEWLG